jgi:RNA polymerase sigma-70 factor (ECF subfamily)
MTVICRKAPSVEPTRPSLLLRVRNLGDQASWQEFVELYGPLVLRVLLRMGMAYQDALDLQQDVMQVVMNRIARKPFQYDPSKSFRAWLSKVARHRAYRHFHEQARKAAAPGGSCNLAIVAGIADSGPAIEAWVEEEHRRRVLEIAMKRVRAAVQPLTWEAFRRSVFDGLPPETVAEQLQTTVGNVYVAKSRVLARLREAVEQIDV